MKPTFQSLSRRRFIRGSAALGLLTGLHRSMPAYAAARAGLKASSVGDAEANGIDLPIREEILKFDDRQGSAVTINGTVPGPLVRLREGRNALLRVTNGLEEDTSIHWHGLLLPPGMDGVPGVSFAGIKAGETFTYRFPVRQNGTYWYHSHSGFQEQAGHYGPLIIDAAGARAFPLRPRTRRAAFGLDLRRSHAHAGAIEATAKLLQFPTPHARYFLP